MPQQSPSLRTCDPTEPPGKMMPPICNLTHKVQLISATSFKFLFFSGSHSQLHAAEGRGIYDEGPLHRSTCKRRRERRQPNTPEKATHPVNLHT